MSGPSSLRFVPWREDYRTAFRLASDDWRPPAQVRTWANPQRDRMTWEAVFARPDGVRVTLTTKMSCDAAGEWGVDEERLDVRLFVAGGSAA